MPEWGTTYGPAGDGPFPGVMLLHGSEGGLSGWSHRLAVLLAAHGYIAYPHRYSVGGNAWNAGAIKDVALDRTAEALQAFRAFALVEDWAALYGVSRGGEHALLLASLMARDGVAGLPDAVAVHAPADVVCGAFDARSFRDSGDPGWTPWDPAKRAWSWRGNSDDLKPTTPIEIERYTGPLFLSCGTADTVWSADMTRRLAARVEAAGNPLTLHLYDGLGHDLGTEGENRHHENLLAFLETAR